MAQPQQKREAEASQKCAQLFKTRAEQGDATCDYKNEEFVVMENRKCYSPVLNTLKCQGGRKRWKINAFCLLICPSKCCMWRAFEFSQFKNFSTVYLMFLDNIACDLAHH